LAADNCRTLIRHLSYIRFLVLGILRAAVISRRRETNPNRYFQLQLGTGRSSISVKTLTDRLIFASIYNFYRCRAIWR
jgi:hypothetical protein